MKSILSLLSLQCCVLLFISCERTERSNNSFEGVVINAPIQNEIIDDSLLRVSDFFAKIDTLTLENKVLESTLGNIIDAKMVDDLIFIRSTSNTLKVFNDKGEYITQIGNRGRGPGEYLVISKFDLLKEKEEVSILDNEMNRILIYSFSGDFIRKIDFEDFIFDFAVLPNGHYLFFNPVYYGDRNRRGLWEIDSNGVFVRQLFSVDDKYRHISVNSHYLVHINPNEIGCQGLEDYDYIYHFKNDSISPDFQFKTDIVIPNKIRKQDKQWTNPNKEYTKTSYYESDRLLVITLTNFQQFVRIIYDKKYDKTYRQSPGYYERIESIDNIFPFFTSCYNGNFIYSIDVESIINDDELHALFPHITKESNPVLVIFRENND